jgi:hypothetical protein
MNWSWKSLDAFLCGSIVDVGYPAFHTSIVDNKLFCFAKPLLTGTLWEVPGTCFSKRYEFSAACQKSEFCRLAGERGVVNFLNLKRKQFISDGIPSDQIMKSKKMVTWKPRCDLFLILFLGTAVC